MNTLTRKILGAALMATTSVWMSGALLFVPVANAQSTADLQAQIQALLVQIQALQAKLATTGGPATSYNFTHNLTVGSKGSDVTALQHLLINQGSLKLSAPTGYFGSLTKAALAAYQKSVGISPAAGYFGPKTQAYVNSLAVAPPGTPPGTPPPAGGALGLSLASDNPPLGNVPVGTGEIVPVLSVNFAAGTNVTVTGLQVTRSGLSADQDISNVYLLDGSKVIATNLSISNGIIGFSNGLGLFTVNAGQTKEITVAVSIVTGATGHTFAFSIPTASAVVSNATGVSGVPLSGNTLTSASVSNMGGLQITNASVGTTSNTGLSINAGQTQFTVGQLTLLAQNQQIQVKSIKLTEVGSVSPTDLTNIKLYSGSTQVGTTLAGVDANNTANFDLSAAPIQLAAGQTAVLYLYADVNGTVGRYFQFSLQHNYDVLATDMMFHVGVLPTLNTGSFPVNASYVNVLSGSLTATRNAASPVNYVLPGGTNQTVAKFDFKAAGEAIRITGINIDLVLGTIVVGNITNLKLVDDQGTQIGTTQATITTTSSAAVYTNLNYLIPANTTRVVSVILDLASSASTGTVQGGVNSIAYQGYTSLATATLGQQLGNILTSNATQLSVYQNSAMGTTVVVAGQNKPKVASFALVAGPASNVQVSNITLQATTSASTAVSANFQNLYMMVGSTQWGTTQGTITDGSTYNFSAPSPVTITAGGQLIVDVYADVKSSATSTYSGRVVTVPATTGVSAVAVATNQPITSAPANAVNGQTIGVSAAGTATYALYNTPPGTQVGMGTGGVVLAQYQVTGSANEALNLTNVYLNVTSTNSTVFTNFKLMAGDTSASTQYGSTLVLQGTGTNTSLTWTGVNIPVVQNGQKVLAVVADANTWANLQATGAETTSQNATTTASVNRVDYQGVASNQTNNVTGSAAGNTFNVLRTTLTPVTASGVTYGGSYSRYLVGAYTVSAGSGNSATLSTITLTQLISNASSSATQTTVYVYDVSLAQDIASSTTVAVNGTATTTFTLANAISGGTSKTYYIYSGVSSFTTKPGSSSASITDQVNLTAWTWTDGTETGIGPSPTIVTPIVGSVNPVVIVP